tara:strand:- start:2960 stop:3142 length:183 start_codon:yes stop_codon:yes gene_type:complete
MNELVERLEAIESMLNEDNPNISDIRIDVGLLLDDLTSTSVEDETVGVEISYSNIQINGC